MNANGHIVRLETNGQALRWPGRVLSATDLRLHLNGHREVVVDLDTVVTPLASEELRAAEVSLVRSSPEVLASGWGYGEDRPRALVGSAVQAVARNGLAMRPFPAPAGPLPCRWARAVAECVVRGECLGGVLFCEDPGLVCCVANKLPGLRAAAVTTVGQAGRALAGLAVNLLAVEMPGRTFYEVKQILELLCGPSPRACPDGVACTLRELDGHAHR